MEILLSGLFKLKMWYKLVNLYYLSLFLLIFFYKNIENWVVIGMIL